MDDKAKIEAIKSLRNTTSARLMDCKAALEQSGNDIAMAIDILRKRNIVLSGVMAEKASNEGLIGHIHKDGRLAIVVLASTTDFVTRNPAFVSLLNAIVHLAHERAAKNPEELARMRFGDSCVGDAVDELAGKVGERIEIREVMCFNSFFGFYVHHDSKQAAVVELDTLGRLDDMTEEEMQTLDFIGAATLLQYMASYADVGKDIAMHVVSAKPVPICVDRGGVPTADSDKERAILVERLKADPKNAKKPPNIIDKILEGQMAKFYAERCLLEQPYYRDGSKTVGQVMADKGFKILGFKHVKACP